MAVSGYMFPKAHQTAYNAEWDWDTDTIKMALVKPAYTPSDAHDYWDDVSTNECSGTGYTTGGETLTTKSVGFTDDASASAWQASTAYAVGDIVRPTSANGHLYMCIIAGTSGGSEPTWDTTPGQDTTDNTVTWDEMGRAYVALISDAASGVDFGTIDLTGAGNGARYAVIYHSTGVGSTSSLLVLIDFGQEENPDGSFKVLPASDGWAATFTGYGGT